MTQAQEILYRLQLAPLCAGSIRDMYIERGAARVHDLRNQGHTITTRPCTNPSHHHRTPRIEYVLTDNGALF